MERSEIINKVFDTLYALPEKESLDIACWCMENLPRNNDNQIYLSIIEEFLMNEWAKDQGQGFLTLTYEGREIIDAFGSYTGFVETYTLPPKESQNKLPVKTISLISTLILILLVAILLLTNTNDDKIIVDQKSKIENQESEIKKQKSKIVSNKKSEIVELKSKIVSDKKSEIEELKSKIEKQKREIEEQKNKIKEQETDIKEQITIIGSLQNVLNNQ